MKRMIVNKYGGPENLVLEECEVPTIEDLSVRIKVENIGVNFADTLVIRGRYQERPRPPFSPGLELSGTIIEIGSKVKTHKVNDRVIGIAKYGSYCNEKVMPAENVYKIPDSMDFITAASFPVAYGTAFGAIDWKGKLKKNQTCLILGAAGGVGLAAVEIAKAYGAKTIAAAGSSEKCETCILHGADNTINYNHEVFRHSLKKLSPEGVNLVIDMIGGETADDAIKNLTWEGKFVIIGFAGGKIPKIPANRLLLKSSSAIGLYWGQYAFINPSLIGDSFCKLMKMYEEKKLNPKIGKIFKLEEASEALNFLLSRLNTGKIILSCN
jgi:NADPH2:quinone reductase